MVLSPTPVRQGHFFEDAEMQNPIPCQPPDVPVFRLDEVHRMQAELFHNAERVLGPRTHDFVIMPAQFVAGTEACAMRLGDEITIQLEYNAARDWEHCTAILGHEIVHALDGLFGPPTWLEEGVACAFGISQCAAWYGRVPNELIKGSYTRALSLIGRVPDVFSAVRTLRAEGLRLGRVTPGRLMDAAPGVDASLAASLCARFEMPKVVGRARSYDYGTLSLN